MKEIKDFHDILQETEKLVSNALKNNDLLTDYAENTAFGKLIAKQQNQINVIRNAYEDEIFILTKTIKDLNHNVKEIKEVLEEYENENLILKKDLAEAKKENVKKKSNKKVSK